MTRPLFSKKQQSEAQDCNVASIVFSNATYQVEVIEQNQTFCPFLHLSDQGDVLDGFCSCSATFCKHLVAGYLFIFQSFKDPLHIRLKHSFWKHLCFIGCKEVGVRSDLLNTTLHGYSASSLSGRRLFNLETTTEQMQSKIKQMIEERPIETEETSLKFSNLSKEELDLWKSGTPSDSLKYELSFWADLAKKLLNLQEQGTPYQINFTETADKLPSWVSVQFPTLTLELYLTKQALSYLIPSLATVKASLQLYESVKEDLSTIFYEPQTKTLHLNCIHTKLPTISEHAIQIDKWCYLPSQGFLFLEEGHICKPVIQSDEIELFLKNHPGISLLRGTAKTNYHIYFDDHSSLHIELFLFKVGDLRQGDAALFGEFIYLPECGFYKIDRPMFTSPHLVIPKHQVSDFVNQHKTWLNRFSGFQIHLKAVEPLILYQVDDHGNLSFTLEFDFGDPVIDLGEWIFVPNKGFLSKRKEQKISAFPCDVVITPKQIPAFIDLYEEDLALVPQFFSLNTPIADFALKVKLSSNHLVQIKPIFSLLPSYRVKRVFFFGKYSYVDGEGFSKFLMDPPFLSEYGIEKTLSAKESTLFFSRLPSLEPWILEKDPKVDIPKKSSLALHSMRLDSKEWILDLSYKTNLGNIPLHHLWQALHSNQKFLPSEAGLLDLSDPKFRWISELSKKQFSSQGVHLSSLEWIQIQALETIDSEDADDLSLANYERLSSFQSSLPLDISKLQSNLRPYQKTGLEWLWFLYSYSLSGLLCDEMGLGKTHQAMALLAGAFEQVAQKALIVCPTSVIYHWQDLLCRFLPHLSVHTFYGASRDALDLSSDLVLTSYGTVRNEIERLRKFNFDIAIFDEIQNAKNSHSQTHKMLSMLHVRVRIGLTGTPIENHLLELKALFDLILPGYLPSDRKFKENFLSPIERGDEFTKKQLSSLIHPFILRRKKSEVLLELPEKTEELSYVDLSQEQKDLYKKLVLEQKEAIKRDDRHALIHIFSLISSLKQLCNHPSLIYKDIHSFSKHSSGKWDLFVEILKEARESGQKVVVFSQYLAMLDLIKLYLNEQLIEFAEIRGSTRNRASELSRFKEDKNCEVFLASLQAAGVGIDLTAASIVIHYDRWWNPAKENQATDRVHRIGQSRGVQVFKLITKKTIEESIHRLIQKKIGILDEIVGFDDQTLIKNLSKEEIFGLLSSLEQDIL